LSSTAQSPTVSRWSWLLPAGALLLVFHLSPFGLTLDRAFFDAASRRPLQVPPLPEDSAIVLIDDQTMSTLSAQGLRWPYPRAVFAQLVAALHKAGAKRIVLDFTFFEESGSSEQDLLLAAVCGASPTVVLAQTAGKPPVFWDEAFSAAHPQFFTQPRTGLVEFQADDDGVARRYRAEGSLAAAAFVPPVHQAGGWLRWHGSLEEIRRRGVPVYSAISAIEAGGPIVQRLLAASPDIIPEQIAAALEAEPELTAIGAAALRGKTIFVGTNASGTFDLKPLPVGKIEPGVLIHWTAWANLTSGGFIKALPRWSALLIAAALGAALLRVALRRSGLAVPTSLAIAFAGLGLAGSYALLSVGWFLPPSSLVAACGLTLLGVVAERYWRVQARRREIQAMFGAYVDPAVVANLVRNPSSLRLGGERREATVFFSDLAGFTDLSEKLRDEPERMVEVVNAYLEDTSECLHREGAYVDKYIGDAVMAVFGVPAAQPDHALAACRAALAAQRALDGINTRYAATGVTLAVRIGLNTGEMIVGNLGSSRKKNYTVMGDAVNLASRLEGANKEFGTGILLGETTARAVAGRMATRPLTRLRVKGKLQAIEVHELVGDPSTLTPAQRTFLDAYLPAYAAFGLRKFAEAATDFSRALVARPDDAVTAEFLRQAREFATQPPPADWEPILTLHSK
jgi:adenylate cyclase